MRTKEKESFRDLRYNVCPGCKIELTNIKRIGQGGRASVCTNIPCQFYISLSKISPEWEVNNLKETDS